MMDISLFHEGTKENHNAAKFFERMDDYDLHTWEQLYGDRMSGFYRCSPRRACYNEMKKRGMKHDPSFWDQYGETGLDVDALKRDWKLGCSH